MPIASSPSTSKRLLTLLSLLQSRRDWPAPVLAERLEVSERTVRRDIERLRELDYAIDATRGPDGGYRLEAGSRLPPLLFDDEQVVALALALRTARALGAGVEEAADRALSTVTRLMPDRLSHRVANLVESVGAHPGRSAVAAAPAVLLRIGEAIRARVELRFDYASPGSAAGAQPPSGPKAATDAQERPDASVRLVRTVEPHHLVLHSGRWYLLGYSAERDDWRVYRADRITPRTHTGRRFAPRPVPGGDPVDYLAARFKGSTQADTWPCRGEAILHAPLTELAPYVTDGTIEAVSASHCRVRLGSWSWEALAAEFTRFTVPLTDAHPAELRTAFATLAARATAAAAAAPAARTGPRPEEHTGD